MKQLALLLFVMTAFPLLINTCPAIADSMVMVDVEVINALQNSSEIDPELSGLARELGPVLNYKGFKLLKKSRLPLKIGGRKELLLSRERRLTLTLEGFESGQARINLKIFKNHTEIFATTLLMADNGSAIIGGPELKKGVMLLRVRGKFDG
ncbi:MAG: hypothetical protein KGY61_10385 [Desulfobacterales bacterium]|nr:hypothetical protein [Desulfobacterales bacterium]